jgi:hypothetical protein
MDRTSAGTEAAAAAGAGSPPWPPEHGGHRCSRHQAHSTRRHHYGASGAGSPAGSGAGHPAPSTGARPPAGCCPTDPNHLINRQPCQADRIPAAVPWSRPHPRRSPCRPKARARYGAASRVARRRRLVLRQRRCHVRCPEPGTRRRQPPARAQPRRGSKGAAGCPVRREVAGVSACHADRSDRGERPRLAAGRQALIPGKPHGGSLVGAVRATMTPSPLDGVVAAGMVLALPSTSPVASSYSTSW